MVSTSLDGGRRLTRHTAVDEELVPPERVMLIFTMPPPAIVAEPVLAVAWTDARHGDWDALFSRSVAGGRRWSPRSRLNDDPPGNGRHQYLPRLSASPDGRPVRRPLGSGPRGVRLAPGMSADLHIAPRAAS